MLDIQTLIAGLIVLGALAYAVTLIRKKVRAFSPKKSCGDDCGCGSNSKKAVQ
ncbi:MAG: FeoB-associated Cys-rich membrane protein [Pyrinomonadaceae bacterium]|nr:FeoB-associated Cys-rich membrane protein [Blastocatellia bacterium]MCW5958151.1 FeoB-associated Cys-rich membrane protein [Pyrinomonadaceae bacterium]